MRRWSLSALVLPALAAIASANSPEPSRETIAAVANACTADGAFGHRFGEKNRKPDAGTGLPPFVVESVSGNGPRDEVFEIVAAASFAHAPMSQEDRGFLSNWVFKKLDADVAARKFLRRQPRADGVAYIAATFVLDLSRDGTTVRITCTSIARMKHAREEMRQYEH